MRKYDILIQKHLCRIVDGKAIAAAELKSYALCSQIHGEIYFYSYPDNRGILIASAFFGLPENKWYDVCICDPCSREKRIYSKEHMRTSTKHSPYTEALVSVYGNDGCALLVCYSEAIAKTSLIGCSLMLREKASSPSGKEIYERLACGLITPVS